MLKKNNILPKGNEPSVFIVNRWLSMVKPPIALIINSTINKWSKEKMNINYISFYRKILPSNFNKIKYIKRKEENLEEENDNLNISKLMECSHREICNYEETLDFLNKTNK